MNQLSPEARRLLKLAQSDDVPDAIVQRRVERSLGRRVALGAAITTGGALIAKTASGARVLALMAKIAGIGGVVTVVGAGYVATRSSDELAQSASPAALSPGQSKGNAPDGAARAEPAGPPAQAPPPAVADGKPEPPRSAPVRKAPPEAAMIETEAPAVAAFPESQAPQDRLLAETTDLRRAQQALRSGDPAAALRLVQEQNRRHEGGVLQQERAAVTIFALCEGGQAERARSEAAKFEERWPESALVARVRASCREAKQ